MGNLIRGGSGFGDLLPKEMGGIHAVESPTGQPPTIVPSPGRRSLVVQRRQQQALKVEVAKTSQQKSVQQAVQGAQDEIRSIFEQRQSIVGQLAQQVAILTDPTLIRQDVYLAAEQMRQEDGLANAFTPSNPWDGISVADITTLIDEHLSGVDDRIVDELTEG